MLMIETPLYWGPMIEALRLRLRGFRGKGGDRARRPVALCRAQWLRARFQKEGKPRAVPGAFRSNPPIKSVNETYAGVLLLRNFQMRSSSRISPTVAFEPLSESGRRGTRQAASRTTRTASQAMREP